MHVRCAVGVVFYACVGFGRKKCGRAWRFDSSPNREYAECKNKGRASKEGQNVRPRKGRMGALNSCKSGDGKYIAPRNRENESLVLSIKIYNPGRGGSRTAAGEIEASR